MPAGDRTYIYFLRRSGLLPPGLRYGFLPDGLRSGLPPDRSADLRSGLLPDEGLANGLAPKFLADVGLPPFLGCALLFYGQAGHHAGAVHHVLVARHVAVCHCAEAYQPILTGAHQLLWLSQQACR